MNKEAKKDYIYGLKILKEAAITNGFNIYIKIMTTNWIKPFCKYLAEKDVCYKFWENVIKQGLVIRVTKCVTFNDIFHSAGKCLFVWSKTPQGSGFWNNLERDIESEFGTIYDDITKLLQKHRND